VRAQARSAHHFAHLITADHITFSICLSSQVYRHNQMLVVVVQFHHD